MKNKNLKEKAYNIIKNKIINGDFAPNQYLEEKILCDITKTSRTPVREAISRLAQEDWVVITPRRGIQVPDITLKQVNDLFQTRENFEPIIIELTFNNLEIEKLLYFKDKFMSLKYIPPEQSEELESLDREFHRYIITSLNNKYISKLMIHVSEQIERFRKLTFFSEIRGEEARLEHLDLIEAILNKDIEKSQKLLKTHVRNSHLAFTTAIGKLNI